MTSQLFHIFDGLGPEAGSRVLDALLSGVDPEVRARLVAGRPLWMIWPAASPGPDLMLVDADGNVVVVIEHKRGAQANATALDTLARWERFDEPEARSLPLPDHTPGWHRPEECRGCVGWWHQPMRNGRWVAALPQNDFYRCTPAGWVRALADGTEISLDDPSNVLWVVLDWLGRSAEEIFPESHTAAQWWTTGYHAFAAGLLDAYARACEDGESSSEAVERLGRIIEMVVYR